MEIEVDKNNTVKITNDDGGFITSQSVEANLLFVIIDKLEDIRSELISIKRARVNK